MPKIVVDAPRPTASVTIATSAKRGLARSWRSA
jgi:hypothetical protein